MGEREWVIFHFSDLPTLDHHWLLMYTKAININMSTPPPLRQKVAYKQRPRRQRQVRELSVRVRVHLGNFQPGFLPDPLVNIKPWFKQLIFCCPFIVTAPLIAQSFFKAYP